MIGEIRLLLRQRNSEVSIVHEIGFGLLLMVLAVLWVLRPRSILQALLSSKMVGKTVEPTEPVPRSGIKQFALALVVTMGGYSMVVLLALSAYAVMTTGPMGLDAFSGVVSLSLLGAALGVTLAAFLSGGNGGGSSLGRDSRTLFASISRWINKWNAAVALAVSVVFASVDITRSFELFAGTGMSPSTRPVRRLLSQDWRGTFFLKSYGRRISKRFGAPIQSVLASLPKKTRISKRVGAPMLRPAALIQRFASPRETPPHQSEPSKAIYGLYAA